MSFTGWRARAVEGTMAVVLVAVCATAVVRTVWHTKPAPPGPHIATLAADGRSQATLEVLAGTPELTIDFGNLGPAGKLLRVSTPESSSAPSLAAAGGVIKVSADHAAAVAITLSSAVSWQLDLASGTTRTTADLRGGPVTGVSVSKGSQIIELTMARPAATVPVRLAAGASQFLLRAPAGVPVRVATTAGAGAISLDGRSHVGVAAGSVFTTPNWAPGTAGLDLDATAGTARITVTTWPSAG